MLILSAEEISVLICHEIADWHVKNENRPADAVIITDEMRNVRQFGDHRDDLRQVISDLVVINTEMWHEQDKMRSENDEVVLRAITNFNPLNQHRNDLIEEIDEIFMETCKKVEETVGSD